MKKKITARVIQGLKPEAKPYQYHDTENPNFLVRIQPSGSASYYFMYRLPPKEGQDIGDRRKLLIGRVDDVSLSDARIKADDYRAMVRRGEYPGATESPKDATDIMTLERFIREVWSPSYQTKRKAHDQQLARLLSGFRPLLGLSLADLTTDHFEQHMVERSKTPLTRAKKKGKTKATILPSAATLNRCNATMRPVLEMARKRGLIPTNPLADVEKAREDKNRAIRAMTKEEEKAIEGVFTKRREDRVAEVAEINARRAAEGRKPIPAVPRFLDYLQPMFVISVESGIRRGEAFSLTWSDVDLKARKLTVRGEVAKSSQSRVVPLTTRAHAILSDWQAQGEGTGLVWPSRIGGDRLKNIDGAWRQLCKDAGITGLRWHDLRHTFGSRAALAGVPMVVLKALMGHSVITTTMRYAHSTEADARAAIALLEGGK